MTKKMETGYVYYSDKNQRKLAQEYEQFLYDKTILTNISRKLKKIAGDCKHGDDLYKFIYYGLSRRLPLLERCVVNVFNKNPFDTGKIPSEDVRTDVVLYIHCFYIHLYGTLENLARIYAIKTGYVAKGVFDLSFFGTKNKKNKLIDTLPANIRNKYVEDGKWLQYVKDTRDMLVHQEPGYLPPYYVKLGNDSEWQKLESLKRSEQMEYIKQLVDTNVRRSGLFPDAKEIREQILKQKVLEQKHKDKMSLLSKQQERYQMFIPTFILDTSGGCPSILYHPQLLVDIKTLYDKINLILDYLLQQARTTG